MSRKRSKRQNRRNRLRDEYWKLSKADRRRIRAYQDHQREIRENPLKAWTIRLMWLAQLPFRPVVAFWKWCKWRWTKYKVRRQAANLVALAKGVTGKDIKVDL